MLPILPPASVVVRHEADRVVVDNGRIRLSVDRQRGLGALAWPDRATIDGFYGEAKFEDGRLRKTTEYREHRIAEGDVRTVKDKFGTGVRMTVHHRDPGQPELRQEFWVYENRPEAFVRLSVVGRPSAASNYLAPIVTDASLRIPNRSPLQSLFVPWDNDMYFRYNSDGWGEGDGNGDGSYEVGAVYDDAARNGLVVGSIDHDQWKSAVRFVRGSTGQPAGMRAFAGVTSKYTHDTQPHGTVRGREVRSPRMLVGYYPDWRDGMERYGDLNALVQPPLPWKGGVPFGWNSWSAHKAKLNAGHMTAATDFVADEVPAFRNDGTAYVNFDSFWDNLKREERADFVKRVHGKGLKAGIYWTPFNCWGELASKVGVGDYVYGDLVLKDAKGAPLPRLDGAYPLDPTHPGTLARIDKEMKEFMSLGFDFIKLDFMSHGALEGEHFDRKVPTGTAAYRVGMQRIVDRLSRRQVGRDVFISLSIAPMFPHGYGHSRRISCDVFANIGATEYLLNSSAYGWWTNNRLYRFNDPDHTPLYQTLDEPPTSETEARTRLNATVISGGLFMESDDMTNPAARARAKSLLGHTEVLDLARRAVHFRSAWGDTGTKGSDAFYWIAPDGKTAYAALFNFDRAATKVHEVPLARMELPPGSWTARDLWSGTESRITGDSLKTELPPTGSALLRLRQE